MPVMQSQRYDLAVIGGGVIGLAVAWRASRDGLRVVVLDRGDPGAAASHVAAGMLAPVTEAEFGEEALLELNLASAARYPSWVEELADEAGADPGYRRSGTLLLARDGDEAEALERLLAFRERLGLAVERLQALGGTTARARPGADGAPRAARARRPFDRSACPRGGARRRGHRARRGAARRRRGGRARP